jgi:O-glycosyl hydrolase
VYYRFAQVSKFVARGAVRVGVTESLPGNVVAFRHPINDRVTIVFDNETPSSGSVSGSLLGLPAVTTFAQWRTSQSERLVQLANVPVSGGAFAVSVPANSVVTLTTVP